MDISWMANPFFVVRRYSCCCVFFSEFGHFAELSEERTDQTNILKLYKAAFQSQGRGIYIKWPSPSSSLAKSESKWMRHTAQTNVYHIYNHNICVFVYRDAALLTKGMKYQKENWLKAKEFKGSDPAIDIDKDR